MEKNENAGANRQLLVRACMQLPCAADFLTAQKPLRALWQTAVRISSIAGGSVAARKALQRMGAIPGVPDVTA